VATSSEDGTVRIWDATTGKEIVKQVPYPNDFPPDGAIFSPDGARVLVTSSQLRIASLWDLKSGKVTQLDAHSAPILSAAFSPGGAWLVTASWDRTARVWDARTGGGSAVLKGHTDRVISVVFSPDSAQVISASEDQSARIWDGDRRPDRVGKLERRTCSVRGSVRRLLARPRADDPAVRRKNRARGEALLAFER
jgi:WD40 repeat protein